MRTIDSLLHGKLRRVLSAAALLQLAACGAPPGDPEQGPPYRTADEQPMVQLVVYFTREEAPHPVHREVSPGPGVLTLALEALLRGPTAAEREDGISSWFSAATAGLLIDASIDSAGHAVVDLADFRRIIPGASSAAGGQVLLAELTGTVAQFEAVHSIEYQLEGSCHRFWVFLQRDCRVLEGREAMKQFMLMDAQPAG